jgi:hypothetical protein
VRVHRARALIGWMDEREAALTLAGRRKDEAASPEHLELVRKKRLVASVRKPSFGRLSVVRSLPRSLESYGAEFQATREGADLVAAGFSPALVDLRGVCAMAPVARTDLDLPDVDGDDLEALARITLRRADEAPAEAEYRPDLRAWVVGDPDLGVLGQFDRPGAGEFAVGLIVGRSSSFLRVVQAGDRFVLTDGYDRAITLLERGIHEVPALVKTHGAVRDLPFDQAHLESAVVFGRRPPLLPDFLDDDVSAEVLFPATRRLLMVRVVEMVLHHSSPLVSSAHPRVRSQGG